MKYLVLMVFLSGCATGYVSSERSGTGLGYSIKDVSPDSKIPYYSHIATYVGNPRTYKVEAKAYINFAAFEHCQKQQKQLIVLADSMDLSKTYRSSELGLTSNGGLYNYDSYKTYPSFIMGFRCDNEFKSFPQVANYRTIKPELIKDYVNDFKGGVQLEDITSNGVFKSDDVLLKVNGVRVLNLMQIYDALSKVDGISAVIEFIRNKKVIKKEVILADKIANYEGLSTTIISDYCAVENPTAWEIDSCIEKINKKTY